MFKQQIIKSEPALLLLYWEMSVSVSLIHWFTTI